MNKHYILSIDPKANYEWDRCAIRNPLTGERPDLNLEIAEAVKNQPGSYLIRVSINVEILEQTVPSKIPTSLDIKQKRQAKLLTVTP